MSIKKQNSVHQNWIKRICFGLAWIIGLLMAGAEAESDNILIQIITNVSGLCVFVVSSYFLIIKENTDEMQKMWHLDEDKRETTGA